MILRWTVCLTWNYLMTFTATSVQSESPIPCPPQMVACNKTDTCIPERYICDGDGDCADGEDEFACTNRGSGCGDISEQSGMNGTITSIGYPSPYSYLVTCRWHIRVPEGYVILLEFLEQFDLEKSLHGQCVYDGISIYQEEPLVLKGNFCGSQRPDPVLVQGNKALVEFQSDGQISGIGFKICWRAQKVPVIIILTATNDTALTPVTAAAATISTNVPNTTTASHLCTGVTHVTGESGQISSPPSFQDRYSHPGSLLCRWTIMAKLGFSIALDFQYFNIGSASSTLCQDGWLAVYDGPNNTSALIGQYCNGGILPSRKLSSANEVHLVMSAPNNYTEKQGFLINFMAVEREVPTTTTLGSPPPGCDGTPIILTSTQGYVTSPNFDNKGFYRNGLDCMWILEGSPGNVFFITFEVMDLEQTGGCRYDYLRIYDTTANNSDSDYPSIHATHTINGSIDAPSRSIVNNISDYLYNNNSNSTALENDNGAPQTSSKTTITEYQNEIANLCGFTLPYDVESESHRVMLKFHSDEQVAGLGFNFSYTQRPPSVRCLDHEFMCANYACINASLVCDGVPDCSDGEEEVACPTLSNCGRPTIQPHVPKIVGGSEANEGSWPWVVSVTAPVSHAHVCGATLILTQWVLTAAHCFDSVYSRNYDGFSVLAGRHKLDHPDKDEQLREVDDIFLHHDYVSRTNENDIALIRLKKPFNLTDSVNIVCLPEDKVPEGTPCYITGWGETLSTCCVDVLKQATVPVLNSSLCAAGDYYGVAFLEHMMCAGYPEGGVDSCGGDSGGPLVCETSWPDRNWELQGIISWGVLCAAPKNPGVYTAVHDYISWIQQTIANNLK